MFFIPLNHPMSVDLVIHALRVAGGQADCSGCPARKVCMKQCLAIADSVARMVEAGTLPSLGMEEDAPDPEPQAPAEPPRPGRLKVVK
ncbi:hypothetical protein DESUT3_01320 [Desulfuromonas versatilis]|uniref:4Fe-4S domain-containing protein n=2 Tax=Desulfuromonas versatilis TaxID=2802975 RepID=A0ABM8HR87_9BACT|nr:hypothetical protein DESUT3_01320 [Desulfuromonas versatilis]